MQKINRYTPPYYLFDARRLLALPGDTEKTLVFCLDHFVKSAQNAIDDHGFFAVALSGGSTPKKLYQALSSEPYKSKIDWAKVLLFWSDERSVAPTDKESNYHMAMVEGGLNQLGIPENHIFRMQAEIDIEKNALDYEKTIKAVLKERHFDLVMLGLGEDGHTASLFPQTAGLHVQGQGVIANFVPQKKTWRMSFSYELINASEQAVFYVLGENKAKILHRVLTAPFEPEDLPSQGVGTPFHPALWIADEAASQDIRPLVK